MSIKCSHLRECIIQPILKKVGLYSIDAEELLVATCAQETLGGKFLIQEGKKGIFKKGALGILQMEAATYADIWKYLSKIPELENNILAACNFQVIPDAYDMVGNLNYSILMGRINYFRVKEKLPPANDIEAIWLYYKKYWNTELGAATRKAFLSNYQKYIKGVL